MKRLVIMLVATAMLAGCMGNTINYITVEQQGTATIENHEDGNTNDLRPDITDSGLPK